MCYSTYRKEYLWQNLTTRLLLYAISKYVFNRNKNLDVGEAQRSKSQRAVSHSEEFTTITYICFKKVIFNDLVQKNILCQIIKQKQNHSF